MAECDYCGEELDGLGLPYAVGVKKMTEEEKIKIPIVSEEGDYCRWCGVDTEIGHSENCPVVLAKKGEEFFEQDSWSGTIKVGWGFRFEPIGEPIFAFHTCRVSNFTLLGVERKGFQMGPIPSDQKVLNRLIKEHLKFWRERLGEEGEYYLEQQQKFFRTMSSEQVDELFKAEGKLRELYKGEGKEKTFNIWLELITMTIVVALSIMILLYWILT